MVKGKVGDESVEDGEEGKEKEKGRNRIWTKRNGVKSRRRK